MAQENPEATIRRLFAQVDAGADVVNEFYDPDYHDHKPSATRALAPGREGVRQAFAILRRAFPDVRHVIQSVIVDGDRVGVRLWAEGTHQGELFGIAPSGRRISQDAIAIYRLKDGRIVERWSVSSSDLLEELRRTASGAATAQPSATSHASAP